jgi:hypothetical protein
MCSDFSLPSFYHLRAHDQEDHRQDRAERRLLYRGALHPLLGHVRMRGLCSTLQPH